MTIHRSWTKLQTVNLLKSGNTSAIGICYVVRSLCPTVISNKDQTILNFCTTSKLQVWTRRSRIKIRQLWTFVPQASLKFELTLSRACVHVVGTSCRTATLMVIKQRKSLLLHKLQNFTGISTTENILGDKEFPFSCSTRYPTRSLRSLVEHSKRNSTSLRAHKLFSILLANQS